MAKDRKKLLHIHSSVPDKQPTAASLEVGEIAVNNAKDQEFLSLKNSDNKVVRFSSDEQIVTIMEKKEVLPYKGYVRGETGPSSTSGDSPTADTYGSYGITDNDLLNNKSNIVVKLNQVAAGNTIEHDKVNGAKDVYNKEVNPTNDGGLTDGAGFFIDMSRYAMQGANPSFSSTTNTCKTTLSGTTIVRGLDGSCGSLLDAKVATEVGDFGSATNTIGTDVLHVSGTTTETHDGVVTITNNSSRTETTTGINTANNKNNYIVNTSGETHVTSTGNTAIHSEGKLGISSKGELSAISTEGDMIITADKNICETAGSATTVFGASSTSVGANCDSSARSTNTYIYGDTITNSANTYNLTANTANTKVTVDNITANTYNLSAQTANTTANTINTSANTINTTATTNYNLTAKTYNLSAQTANTTANTINTSANTINTTATTNYNLSAKTYNLSAQTANTTAITENHTTTSFTVSTSAACIVATNTASMGGDVNTNVGTDCAGTAISNVTNVYGDTINESGDTINTTANTSYNLSAKTYNLSAQTANTTANTYNLSAKTENHNNEYFNVTATSAFNVSTSAACINASSTASMGGDVNTNVGTDCAGTAISNVTNIYGDTINESANTYNLSANTANTVVKVDNITANTYNLSAQTANTTANTYNLSAQTANTTANTYNVTAKTENHNNEFFNVTATSAFNVTTSAACIVASNTASMGGDVNTNLGTDCGGNPVSNITNIYGDTINESGDTINTTANTSYNLSAKTYNLSAQTANTTAITENHNNEYFNVTATSAFNVSTSAACINANNSANIGGASATTIGKDCAGTSSHTTNIFGEEINNYSSSYTVNASAACINASSTASLGGLSATTIGEDCGGNTSDVTNVYGDTINVSGDTFNVSGDTHFNNEVYFNEEIHIASGQGFDTKVSWTYGDVKKTGSTIGDCAKDGFTNFSGDTCFTIPRCAADINRATFGYSYGDVHSKEGDTGGTYDPGEICSGVTKTDSVIIPTSIKHLNEWTSGSSGCFTIDNNLCVTGNITATGSVFSTSDERKKENIKFIDVEDKLKARNIPLKSFNFKEDLTKRKVYGVIAQEVEAAGLDELVHTDEEGMKSVDYTSFLILRMAYLERMVGHMHTMIVQLENKLNEK